jgi:uncharacterized OB-fold protein
MTDKEDVFEVPFEIADHFSYSYGGISRFFEEIVENERLMGTECPECGTVLCPPRAHCSECLVETEWVELDGTGTVMSTVDTYYVPETHNVHDYFNLPYILALVRLDGADNELMSVVITDETFEADSVPRGTPVEVGFREEREGYITDIFFTPLE